MAKLIGVTPGCRGEAGFFRTTWISERKSGWAGKYVRQPENVEQKSGVLTWTDPLGVTMGGEGLWTALVGSGYTRQLKLASAWSAVVFLGEVHLVEGETCLRASTGQVHVG